MLKLRRGLAAILLVTSITPFAAADVRLPALFSDHAVLQRDMPVPVWGWADPGEEVKVSIAGQAHTTKAGDDGRWQVKLEPLKVGEPLTLVVEGKNRLEAKDILAGDVWICSGQSNMEWEVQNTRDAELELAAANYPRLRLITVATLGVQEPLQDFDGRWQTCTPESVASFSAVGYFFGRDLLQIEGVPVGLIDNSWGGSACEAWIRRDLMEGNPLYDPMLAEWDRRVAGFDEAKAKAEFDKNLAAWEERAKKAREEGRPEPPGRPWWTNPVNGQLRPSNLYNGRLCPIMPYAIRGVIWYQGETNGGRGFQYRQMFPLMIQSWRDAWGQGDFPFYWVQLADFQREQSDPGNDGWAELREAQTMTLDRLPNTGQAVIVDVGEANDIHPRDKQTVGHRLARLALAKTYGRKLAHNSPRYASVRTDGDSIIVTFKDVNGKLVSKDGKPVEGFAIAGWDRNWMPAEAEIISDNEVRVRSNQIGQPVAVRYAWAINPVCNLFDTTGLPVTPFRTDSWPGVSDDNRW